MDESWMNRKKDGRNTLYCTDEQKIKEVHKLNSGSKIKKLIVK